MSKAAQRAIEWTESGLIPDAVIRRGIRRMLQKRLEAIQAEDIEHASLAERTFVEHMDQAPIALVPELANEQHYEVPAEFFSLVLGEHRKYSCCYWDDGVQNLDAAERAGLELTCERAEIEDGLRVLDLGCGWGSLSLYIAENYPNCRVSAVSNSQSQHDYITRVAEQRGLSNIDVTVADMNDFAPAGTFDRVVSVEMFEHMRNYRALFRRISRWLEPDGRFFMHIFVHRSTPYEFVDQGSADWMSRHFFSGGIMPSDALPLHFQDDLAIAGHWRWNGAHYGKTANAWLANMDARRADVVPVLAATYGDDSAKWWMRWRMFFMACAELFDYKDGTEWYVGHYLFRRQDSQGRSER